MDKVQSMGFDMRTKLTGQLKLPDNIKSQEHFVRVRLFKIFHNVGLTFSSGPLRPVKAPGGREVRARALQC